MKKIPTPAFLAFYVLISTRFLHAQPLPVSLHVEPFWNPDSTWVMAFPGSDSCPTTSIGLSTPIRLSSLNSSTLTLNQGFSGRIYFFVQQGDSSLIMPYVAGIPADTSFTVRYDFIEITYFGNSNDCSNLSSVDQFGLTLSMATRNDSGQTIQSRGYNVNALQMQHNLNAISRDSTQSAFNSGGSFIRIMSPLHAPQAYFNMEQYVRLLNQARDTIRLFDAYDGSVAVYDTGSGTQTGTLKVTYPPQPFYYLARFNAGGDSLVMEPDASVKGISSFIQGTIRIDTATLNAMIYACDGPFHVSVPPGVNGPPVPIDRIGYNDPWSTVMRNLVVGFNTGYYGYTSGTLNENNSWEWNPNDAFKLTHHSQAYYNAYAKTVQASSNSYGFPFTDFIEQPLLGIFGCDTLQISVWSDTVTQFPDYTPNIPLDTNGYTPGIDLDTNYGQNIVFYFGNSSTCYTYGGALEFYHISFATGKTYTQLNPQNASPNTYGTIALTGFPIMADTLNRYPFTIEGATYTLYIRTDPNYQFTEAYTDHAAITVAMGEGSNSVTLSNLQYVINPAYLADCRCHKGKKRTKKQCCRKKG